VFHQLEWVDEEIIDCKEYAIILICGGICKEKSIKLVQIDEKTEIERKREREKERKREREKERKREREKERMRE
jgi:hypothetical protein